MEASSAGRRNISSDRAIETPADDRYGFGDTVVPRLVRAATEWPSDQGIVVGLYGPWGAGKSSVLNLLASRLAGRENSDPTAPRVVLVRFTPTFYDDHASLVRSFFGTLARDLGNAGPQTDKLARQMRLIGAFWSAAASGVGLFSPLAKPFMEGIGKTFSTLGDTARLLDDGERTLQDAREAARTGLYDMARGGYRVVVLLDDLERLEKSELLNVLKLVRFVADLPNITFVVSMDDVRARVLISEGGGDPEYGRDYLEKYVQAVVRVPAVELQKIAALIEEEVTAIFKRYGATFSDRLQLDRNVFELHDSALVILLHMIRVPRDLARWSNSLTMLLLSDERTDLNVDDAALIAAVETFHPSLYEHIRRNRALLTGELDLEPHLFEEDEARRKRLSAELAALTHHPRPEVHTLYEKVLKALFGNVLDAHEPADPFNIDREPEAQRRIRSARYFYKYFGAESESGVLSLKSVLALVAELEAVAGTENGYEGVSGVLRTTFESLEFQGRKRLISDLHIHLGKVDRARLEPIGLGTLHLGSALEPVLAFELFSAALLRVCGPTDHVRYGDAQAQADAARLVRAALVLLPGWKYRTLLLTPGADFARSVTDQDWKALATEWSRLLEHELASGFDLYKVYDESTADFILWCALKIAVDLRRKYNVVPGWNLALRLREYVSIDPARFETLVELILAPQHLSVLDNQGEAQQVAEEVLIQIDDILHDPGYSMVEIRSSSAGRVGQAASARTLLRKAIEGETSP